MFLSHCCKLPRALCTQGLGNPQIYIINITPIYYNKYSANIPGWSWPASHELIAKVKESCDSCPSSCARGLTILATSRYLPATEEEIEVQPRAHLAMYPRLPHCLEEPVLAMSRPKHL